MTTAAAAAAVARGAGVRAAAVAALWGGGGGTAAGRRPRSGPARPLCTAPGTAPDMKRYLWERYQEAKRSTDGECGGAPLPCSSGYLPARRWEAGQLARGGSRR